MKNFKKVLAVMTAVASMCMSASAFAAVEGSFVTPETNGVSGTFDYTNSTFTITSPASTGEVTILVLNPNVNDTNVQSGDIRYINQATGGNFGTMGLKLNPAVGETPAETNLPVGEYPVKVGYYKADGSFAIATATLKVEDVNNKKTLNLKWGDVTLDGSVDVSDALAALYLANGDARKYTDAATSAEYTVGTSYGAFKWGDVTCDGSVDVSDALAALYLANGDARQYTHSNGKTYTVGTSTTIEVE